MSDLLNRAYQRPPMARGLDPQRVNWLWRLVCEVSALTPREVLEGLHFAEVGVSMQRVDSWLANDTDDNYFPLTIAEMERNIRSVLAMRKAAAELRVDAPEPAAS
jgi:hypothetical protein